MDNVGLRPPNQLGMEPTSSGSATLTGNLPRAQSTLASGPLVNYWSPHGGRPTTLRPSRQFNTHNPNQRVKPRSGSLRLPRRMHLWPLESVKDVRNLSQLAAQAPARYETVNKCLQGSRMRLSRITNVVQRCGGELGKVEGGLLWLYGDWQRK